MNRLIRMLLGRTLEDALFKSVDSTGSVKAIIEAWQDNALLGNNLGTERRKADIAIRAFVKHVLHVEHIL